MQDTYQDYNIEKGKVDHESVQKRRVLLIYHAVLSLFKSCVYVQLYEHNSMIIS